MPFTNHQKRKCPDPASSAHHQQQLHDAKQHQHQQQHRAPAVTLCNNLENSSSKKRRMQMEDQLNNKDRLFVRVDVDKAVHLDSRALFSLLDAERCSFVEAASINAMQHPKRLVANTQQNQPPGREPKRVSVLEANGNTKHMQTIEGVSEHLRSEAVVWLGDVCKDEGCDAVVYPLAIAYMDRVLATKFVPRRNRQVLAASCLLLATKMKAPLPISAERIVFYTDNGVRLEELLDWEMLVLNQLQWNLVQATAFEFFDQMMVRAPVLESLRDAFIDTLPKMLPELSLATLLPSWQASACLMYVAFCSKKMHLKSESVRCIQRHLGIDVQHLKPFIQTIERKVGLVENDSLVSTPVPPEPQHSTPCVGVATEGLQQHQPQIQMVKPDLLPALGPVTEYSPDQVSAAKRMHLTENDDPIEFDIISFSDNNNKITAAAKSEQVLALTCSEEMMEEEIVIMKTSGVEPVLEMAPLPSARLSIKQLPTTNLSQAFAAQHKSSASVTWPEVSELIQNSLPPLYSEPEQQQQSFQPSLERLKKAQAMKQQQQRALSTAIQTLAEDDANSRSSTISSGSSGCDSYASTRAVFTDSGFLSGPGGETPARNQELNKQQPFTTTTVVATMNAVSVVGGAGGGKHTIENMFYRCNHGDFGVLF